MADHNKQRHQVDTGDLALKCAEFFMSLGESCLEFYHKYNKEKERKTKIIKKAQRTKARVVKKHEGEGDQMNDEIAKKIPKKPLTAYIIYFQQKKPNFVEKHPDLNLSELTKLIAKQWKELDNNQKNPYLSQAQEDRKRFEQQMKQFKAKYGTAIENNPSENNQSEDDIDDNEESQNFVEENKNQVRNEQNLIDEQKLDQEDEENQNQQQNENQNENQNGHENELQNGDNSNQNKLQSNKSNEQND